MTYIDRKGDLVTDVRGYAAGGEREAGCTNVNRDRFRCGDTGKA